jgi:hypothetical protein
MPRPYGREIACVALRLADAEAGEASLAPTETKEPS